ncbi:MAG: hypothetical protein RSP_18160 [Rhodanobacter sp.]
MKLLTQEDLNSLVAMSSPSLTIAATQKQATLRLAQVVALTNFKAIASAGRVGSGAAFDNKTKTLTLTFRPVSEAVPGSMAIGFEGKETVHGFRFQGQFYEAPVDTLADVVAIYPHDNWAGLVKVAKRLAGGKAKTFATVREAMKQRQPRFELASSANTGLCQKCGRPIKDAPHHRAIWGYCGECAFDEFDV